MFSKPGNLTNTTSSIVSSTTANKHHKKKENLNLYHSTSDVLFNQNLQESVESTLASKPLPTTNSAVSKIHPSKAGVSLNTENASFNQQQEDDSSTDNINNNNNNSNSKSNDTNDTNPNNSSNKKHSTGRKDDENNNNYSESASPEKNTISGRPKSARSLENLFESSSTSSPSPSPSPHSSPSPSPAPSRHQSVTPATPATPTATTPAMTRVSSASLGLRSDIQEALAAAITTPEQVYQQQLAERDSMIYFLKDQLNRMMVKHSKLEKEYSSFGKKESKDLEKHSAEVQQLEMAIVRAHNLSDHLTKALGMKRAELLEW